MASSNPSFNRREREMVKKRKAASKRERRQARPEEAEVVEGAEVGTATEAATAAATAADQAEVLRRLAELNAGFEAGRIGFDDFEVQRNALLVRIEVS